ncbi:UDP-3-O-acyl-N-acetylglucosamine deacetylase [Candidatus Gracilibacteria bacterium]|nr:UDP-3-O-acyl-N-acetylglucosamine deacetylase [Candidatus Gracilibacteria bacterium]
MKIAPLKDIPERPIPIFDNTDEEGTDFSKRKVLDTPAIFDEQTTFFRKKLGLNLFPCVVEGVPGVAINDSWSPLILSRMNVGKNNIGMLVNRTRVQIMEHVIGVLAGLGVDADIILQSSLLFSQSVSLPTKIDCAQEYIDTLLKEGMISTRGTRKTFTVVEPTMIDFENKRGSYALLLPAEDAQDLTIDVMVSYPGAIGTQRLRVKINDEVMRRYIAGARTPSYGFRRKLMRALDIFPVLQNIVNINTEKTTSIDKKGIINPRTEYDFNDINLELLMHEVLDKLGAYGIPLDDGARFVGTVMIFAAGHGHDLSVMKSMQQGVIKTTAL